MPDPIPSKAVALRWRRLRGLKNGSILRSDVDGVTQQSLLSTQASDVLTCYVDPSQLRRLAKTNGDTLSKTFRSFLPTKPHLRSGDFREMLMWRLLQDRGDRPHFPLMRWRTRQSRDDTVRGTDLLGYAMKGTTPSKNDVLVVCEIKTRYSKKKETIVLEAYEGAKKNYVTRLADQLFFQQNSLLIQGDHKAATAFARFSNPHKYGEHKIRLTAAVVHDAILWDDKCLTRLPKTHRVKADVEVLIVCAEELRTWIGRVRTAAIRYSRTLSAPSR